MIFDSPIQDLASRISERGGLARPNLFAVTFNGPASINPDMFLVNAICESASLPGRAISTNEHTTTKHATKTPYTFINDDITLTFLVTNDFYIKNLFEKWMKHVINDEAGKIYYKSQYASDMTITILSLDGKMVHKVQLEKAFPIAFTAMDLSNASERTVHKVQLENAFPIAFTAMELSNASESQIMRFTVTMTYDNFKSNTTYFTLASSLAEFKNALSFPNPLMPSLPFSPFGDLGDQAETLLAGLKSELAGEMTAVLNSLTSQIRDKILGNAASITTPYEGSLGSVISQISGKVTNIFGAGLGGTVNEAATQGSQAVLSRTSSTVRGLSG